MTTNASTNAPSKSEPNGSEPAQSLAREIRRRREAVGLSRRELASRVNVSTIAVQKWEQGHRTPDGQTQARLWEVLDAGPDAPLCPDCGSALRPFVDCAEWIRTWFADRPQAAEALVGNPEIGPEPPLSWQLCTGCGEAVFCPVRTAE